VDFAGPIYAGLCPIAKPRRACIGHSPVWRKDRAARHAHFLAQAQIAILDDLVADDDARSGPAMELIKDTVYKGVNHALDPRRRKVIFNGTPFNKGDVLVQAVESGAWAVNVWPVCERFPCAPQEFRGAWPQRFGYDYLLGQYEMAKATGPGVAAAPVARRLAPGAGLGRCLVQAGKPFE